jgi:hypothetical protein
MSSKSWKKKKKVAGKAKKSRAAKRSGRKMTPRPATGHVSAPVRRSSAPAYFNAEDLDRKLQGDTAPVTGTAAEPAVTPAPTAVAGTVGTAEAAEPEAPVMDAPELPHAALPTPQLLQLRIDLKGAKPPIWRRVEVRSDLTLDAVHRVIQAAFGWTDTHSHRFTLDGDAALPEAQVRLDETLQEAGDSLRYLYDDTDNWNHQIKVEKILDTIADDAPDAAVTGGRRATPPENCGGLLTEAELAEMLDDPAHFDVAEADARLN